MKNIIPIILGILLASVSFFYLDKEGEATNIHQLFGYDEKLFYEGIIQASREPSEDSQDIIGGVIPHHLLASFMIADFFDRLKEQNPQTIILIGPNHFEKGDFIVLSSLYDWQTPFGRVQADQEIIADLVDSNLARIDESTLSQEHAIGSVTPFINFYLPRAKIVPIVLSPNMKQEQALILAEKLSLHASPKTVIIASVDFSHYLHGSEETKKDEITLEAMKNFNYSKLYTMNSDYLDSYNSVAVLLMAMEKKGIDDFKVLNHTNSSEILGDNSIETTSYFEVVFNPTKK